MPRCEVCRQDEAAYRHTETGGIVCERCATAEAFALACPFCHSTFPMPMRDDPDLACPYCHQRLLEDGSGTP